MKMGKKNQNQARKASSRMRHMRHDDIAVIGVACRFPGANDRNGFWENLNQAKNSIREIPPSRWDLESFYSPDIEAPNKSVSKWCGLLDDIEYFDNRFFSISPREAKSMDPQQRMLLEETWHCIEDASVPLKTLQSKSTSVHVGVMASDYHQEISAPGVLTDSYAALGNYDCILANRLSYFFGFSGPSLSIDAACASSLVALHKAKSTLLMGESDFAIAAGVSLNFHPWKNISFSKSRMFSPDGQCKTFDKDANGYVPGEGIGVVLLQPLQDAIAEGRHIYGLIKGSAVNHVGQALSITAPRVEAQRKVILAAYADADISPSTVTYVEAHGSGTSLGDPIEVEALTQAFRTYTEDRQYCKIGTVKTNIGHLEASAGIAGVIKVLMMMRHRRVPETLNVKTLNPIINFKDSPFQVAMENTAWQPREAGMPLRAGVSSFGFGGANAHAIIESYSPEPTVRSEKKQCNQLFLLSARSQKALALQGEAWRQFVESESFKESSVQDMCRQLQVGRDHFPYRTGTMVRSKEEIRAFVSSMDDCTGIQKVNGQRWFTTFGQMPWVGISQVKSLENKLPNFAQRLEKVKAFLESREGGKQLARGFRRAKWAKKNIPCFRFLVGTAWYETLEEMGFQPRGVYGKGQGAIQALYASGMLSLENAAKVLLGEEDLTAMPLSRPRLPFWDGTHQIKPFHIQTHYLKELIEGWSISEEDLRHYAEKAFLLVDIQYTFKKYIADWEKVLGADAKPIREWLVDEALITSADDALENKRKLLIIIIKSSLGKLNKKWDLATPKTVKIEQLHEILDLLQDEVLQPEDLVAAMMSEKPDWSALAGILNQRQDRLKPTGNYAMLRRDVGSVSEIENQQRWLSELQQEGPRPDFGEKATHLILGGFTEALPERSVHLSLEGELRSGWLSALLTLWQHGAHLNWASLHAEEGFVPADLPQYRFDRKPYWLNKAQGASKPPRAVSAVLEEKPAAMTASVAVQKGEDPLNQQAVGRMLADPKRKNRFYRILNGTKDLFIKDTMLLGFEVVPSPLRLEMALEATRRLTGEPINTLRNVLFQNFGIVHGDYRLDVDVDSQKNAFVVSSDHGPLCQGKMSVEPNEPMAPVHVGDLMQGYSELSPEIYEKIQEWGYNYGPTLKLIEQAFDNDQAYVYKLGVVPITEGKVTGLDPHLLDCVFQCVFWSADRKAQLFNDACLYVPFTVKSLKVIGQYNMDSMVVIPKDRFKVLANQDLLLDFQAYDLQGCLRLDIKGMLFKRVDREYLENSLKQSQPKFDVEVVPNGGCDIASLKPALDQYADNHLPKLLELESGMAAVEALGRDLLLRTFQEKIGIFLNPGKRYSLDSLREELNLIPKYERLLAALIELLTRQGYLVEEGDDLVVTPLVIAEETKQNMATVEARKQAIGKTSADMKPFLNLLEVAVTHYPEVLAGKMTHLEVLFPKGSGALFENIYKNNGISDHYNCLVTLALVNYVVNAISLDPNAKVRILEVGSGTGGTSAGVLAALKPYGEHIEYTYTDISLGFVNFGKRTFGSRFDFANFKVLDIEKSVIGQGFDFQGYDLVFETNCIHATRDINQTVEELKRLLKPGGLLIINELSQLQDFWTLVAGLIDGWWLFKDPEPRVKHSPLLSHKGWRQVFESHGYIHVYGVEETRKKPYEQAVILAESDGIVDRGAVEIEVDPVLAKAAPTQGVAASGASLKEKLSDHLREIFAETLQMSAHEIEIDGDFSEYGIDSMVVLDIIDRLEKTFGELPKTLLFENMTLANLATWFENNHGDFCRTYYADRNGSSTVTAETGQRSGPEGHGKDYVSPVVPVPFESLQQAVTSLVASQSELLASLEQGMAEVEHFGRLLLLREFQGAGLIQEAGARFTQTEFAEKLGLIEKYQRLGVALTNMLTKHGFLERDGDQFVVQTLATSETVQSHIKLLHERKENIENQVPTLKPFLNLLEVAVTAYTDILSGKKTHLEVLFPKGSGTLFEFIYKGNDLSDFYNSLVRQALVTYVEQVKTTAPERGVRILEIGSGTGGTSAGVMEALMPFREMVEYYYTDISLGFTNFGKRTFGPQYPFAKFMPLDIEKDVLKQGFDFQGYDIIFETNCIHAVAQLDRSMREIKKLLKADGLLIVNEISQLQDVWTLVAGLIDGWWLFEDGEIRIPDSPLLSYKGWQNLFASHGFHQSFGAEPDREKAYEQAVIVAQSDGQVSLTEAERAQLKPAKPIVQATTTGTSEVAGESRRDLLLRDLQQIFAQTLEMRPDDMDPEGDFSEYGIDSMITLDLIDRLEKDFGELPKTLLFEHHSLASLITYFEKEHATRLDEKYPQVQQTTVAETTVPAQHADPRAAWPSRPSVPTTREPMAIVGLSGRYPKSPDLETLWTHLSEGNICTEEVPADRWNVNRFYDPDRKQGKAYTKWGGFLEDYDKFDALFFNIAPRQAELMDPQQRIFLETVWATLESAGHTRASLGNSVGVFVGVTTNTYGFFGIEQSLAGNVQCPDVDCYDIANRISYFFDFNGPSIALDSACSSSLSALHLACQSVWRGECEAAIAGGVSLTMHPNRVVQFCSKNMLSATGKSMTFGEGANGFVDAEGVGAVLIKPLSAAVRDRDHVLGIIRGSSVNAGGRTHGYTVPNPNAQANLVTTALEDANLQPSKVDYIEAHGTGTSLGDPIEIAGLTQVFGGDEARSKDCPIGSIKTNIGHTIACAGMAGVTKVLLQMQHRQLVPSLNSTQTNAFIDFKNAPFYIPQALEPWQPQAGEQVLRAGVSSFGAGGANAHVILESPTPSHRTLPKEEAQVLIFSAKAQSNLRAYLEKFLAYLQKGIATTTSDGAPSLPPFADIAFTLQVGRKSLPVRLALVASNVEQAAEILTDYLEGREPLDVFEGELRARRRFQIEDDEDGRAYIQSLIRKGKLRQLAGFWTEGIGIDWDLLDPQRLKRRVPLPTYCFTRERYWIPETTVLPEFKLQKRLHPLIDHNTSDFEVQSYTTTLTHAHFEIADHVIGGTALVPAAAYIEMARAAGEMAAGEAVSQMGGMVWRYPAEVEDERELKILLEPEEDQVLWQVVTEDEGELVLHSEGAMSFISDGPAPQEPPRVAIDEIRARCNFSESKDQVYACFVDGGLSYGKGFRGIEQIWFNDQEAIVNLSLPEFLKPQFADYQLHPCLLDSALQGTMRVLFHRLGARPYLAFSLAQLDLLAPLPMNPIAHVRRLGGPTSESVNRFDVVLCDENGHPCVVIHEFSLLADQHHGPSDEDDPETYIYRDQWEETPALAFGSNNGTPVMILEKGQTWLNTLRQTMPGSRMIHVQPGLTLEDLGEDTYQLDPTKPQHWANFLNLVGRGEMRCLLQAPQASWFPNRDEAQQPPGLAVVMAMSQGWMDGMGHERIPMIYLHEDHGEISVPFNAAIEGFAQTLRLESPHLDLRTLAMDTTSGPVDLNMLAASFHAIWSDRQTKGPIRFSENRYWTKQRTRVALWDLVESLEGAAELHFRQNGSYLITGGTGGIGFAFAKHLAEHYQARVTLCGRSPISPAIEQQLEHLRQMGGEAIYLQADLADKNQVNRLISQLQQKFKTLNGWLHAAGVNRDALIRNKTEAQLEAVLAPKVRGLLNLDEITAHLPLDFAVCFSSLVALIGNKGQADYGYANAFMDHFVAWREKERREGRRMGKGLAINWPLWEEGGMVLDERTIAFFEEQWGMVALPSFLGVAALQAGLQLPDHALAVAAGDPDKLDAVLARDNSWAQEHGGPGGRESHREPPLDIGNFIAERGNSVMVSLVKQ